MKRRRIPLVLLLAFPVFAQESASYKLDDHTLNAGGKPADGVVLSSTTYKITFDAIGDAAVGADLSGTGYRMDGSFLPCFPPPGEVVGLRFTDAQTLTWQPEKSVGVYNLYRGLVNGLDGTLYGSCEKSNIDTNTTTDGDPVPEGDGHYYLVTAKNRLGEEGTLGQSSEEERFPASACP